MNREISKLDNYYKLIVPNAKFNRLLIDAGLYAMLEDTDTSLCLRVGGLFNFLDRNTHLLDCDPCNIKDAQLLAQVLKVSIASFRLGFDGSVLMDFEDKTAIEIPMHPEYETWELSMADGFLLIGSAHGIDLG